MKYSTTSLNQAQSDEIVTTTTTVSPTTKTMTESVTVEVQDGSSISETDNSFNNSSVFDNSNNPSTTTTPIPLKRSPVDAASVSSPRISPKIIQSENEDTSESQTVNINPKYDETSSDPDVTIDYKSDEQNVIQTDSVTSEMKNE